MELIATKSAKTSLINATDEEVLSAKGICFSTLMLGWNHLCTALVSQVNHERL